MNPSHKAALRAEAEKIKKDLTFDAYADAEVLYNNEYLTVRVTREEFETASRELLMRTIEATKKMFERHSNQKPETIYLNRWSKSDADGQTRIGGGISGI